MVVARSRYRGPQQALIFIHRLNNCHQKQQELRIFIGGIAGRQQIYAGIRGDGPVVVFAGTVDPGKRLFMQQADKTVLGRYLLHDLHGQLVVVTGDVGSSIDRSQFVLCGSYLVVLRLSQNTQLPEFFVQLLHISRDPWLNGTEVMVVQFLPLGRFSAEQGPAGVDQVMALFVHGTIHQKILLLRTDRGSDPLYILVTKQLQHTKRLLVQRLHGAKQRCLLVQRLAAVRTKCRGDTKGLSLDEGIAGRVPCGIASSLKSSTQTTGGERRGIGFTLNELLAGKLHDDTAIRGGRDEAVVLFRRNAGQRLEPMGEVGRSIFNRPIPHRCCYCICNGQIQLLAGLDGLLQGIVNISGKAGFHHTVIKDPASKQFRYGRHCIHPFRDFGVIHRRTPRGGGTGPAMYKAKGVCAHIGQENKR